MGPYTIKAVQHSTRSTREVIARALLKAFVGWLDRMEDCDLMCMLPYKEHTGIA